MLSAHLRPNCGLFSAGQLIRMQLAFAITDYFPYGGAQRDFFAVATEMSKRGHRISVITSSWQGEKPEDWALYPFRQTRRSNVARVDALSSYVVSLKRRESFDAVVGFTRLRGLDTYFAADPCFAAGRYRGLRRLLPRYRIYAAIERELFANPALRVIFLTRHQRQEYQACFHVEEDNQLLLPVCVERSFHFDAIKFDEARVWRAQHQRDKHRIVLLFVAADFNTKGLDRVIGAIAALTDGERARFELWVVGGGKQQAYEHRLRQLKCVAYQFWGGQGELPRFYLAADYLLHPARREVAGMVLAEAAAARLPMLISDTCGYGFLARADERSALIPEKSVVAELSVHLKRIANEMVQPSRSEANPLVSADSRARICCDQIEAWYG